MYTRLPFEFARWLGFTVEQAKRMRARYPCLGQIGTLSGMAPTPKTKGKEPLGACVLQRLCVPCCVVVERLAGAWRIPCATACLAPLLPEAAAVFQRKLTGHAWQFTEPPTIAMMPAPARLS